MPKLTMDEFLAKYEESSSVAEAMATYGSPEALWNKCVNPIHLVELLRIIGHRDYLHADTLYELFVGDIIEEEEKSSAYNYFTVDSAKELGCWMIRDQIKNPFEEDKDGTPIV